MSNKIIQSVRGTHDYYGADMALMRHIMDNAEQIAAYYGFDEIQTPIFEFSEVFHRSLGDSSDVVSKETYSFADRGGEAITLRPEFTASIVRAFISGGYTQQLPFKAFYAGPAFRYERPQKGRMRQLHQIGVEYLGARDALHDVEMIALADHILRHLLGDAMQNVTLELNTLGDTDSRSSYRLALLDYLTPLQHGLSEESKTRLHKNPLRILDSKQEQDKEIVRSAPLFSDYLSAQASDWFAAVRSGLDTLGVAYQTTPKLVRGLDYYTHSVFEFTTTELGAQATILAGGRYNGLVEQLGGGDIAGVGFAAGIERLMLLLQAQYWQAENKAAHLAVMATDTAYDLSLLKIVQQWRESGLKCEILQQRHFSKAMKKAGNIRATHFMAYGEAEAQSHMVKIRHLNSRTESEAMEYSRVPQFISSS